MKAAKIFTIAVVLFVFVSSLGLKQHQNFQRTVQNQIQHDQQEKHDQGAMAAFGSEAAKQLIENPAKAAQIPTQFIQGKIEGIKKLFEGAWDIRDRSRSLQLTFVNFSGKNVNIEDVYFDSGTWYQSWLPTLKSGMVSQATVANRQGSWFTGVTGGMRLRIQGTGVYIYIGFNNPYIGSFKNYGELSSAKRAAKYGYDNSRNNNPKSSYFGGYRLQVVQTPSSITQMAIVYSLSKA